MKDKIIQPPKELINDVGWNEHSTNYKTIFPATTKDEPGICIYVSSLYELIRQFYKYERLLSKKESYANNLTEDHNRVIRESLHVALEGLRNCKYHGTKDNSPFSHELYLAPRGILQAFHDSGGYFARKDIKEKFETKTRLKEGDFDLDYKEGFRVGVNEHIFKFSDKIIIDTDNEILYTTNTLKR